MSKLTGRAYTNLEFLRSPEARTIRILSEFVEPQRRFRQFGIRNTVVFFGSAKIKNPIAAKKDFKQLSIIASKKKKITPILNKELQSAEVDLRMSRYYDEAVALSTMLTKWSKTLPVSSRFSICSGGGPGIMEAANKGAIQAGGNSIGLNITLPTEQGSNKYLTPGLDFNFHYFFMRKFWFVYLAKALIIFPGGFGTLDELFEVLTLVQTKKVTKKVVIVVYGREYWNQVINFQAMVNYKTILSNDLSLIRLVDSPEEAFQYLKTELQKNFKSNETKLRL
jgi:uncharacterized protein (TIGR00730 family)